MGINVRTESEEGEAISELLDPYGRTQALLPDYRDAASPCLRFVDLYGDAVFNQMQVPVLIGEVRERLRDVSDTDVRTHWEEILRLIESVEGKTHTYVRFVGD